MGVCDKARQEIGVGGVEAIRGGAMAVEREVRKRMEEGMEMNNSGRGWDQRVGWELDGALQSAGSVAAPSAFAA
jgi:hypothetical protein